MTPKEAFKVGNKVWTGYRVVTLKENHRIDSTTKWWHIEEDNYEYREDRFEEIPIYVQNLLKALTELEALKRYPTSKEVCEAIQSEYRIEQVVYRNGVFYDNSDDDIIISKYSCNDKPHLNFHDYLFSLDTLLKICRFYEGVGK